MAKPKSKPKSDADQQALYSMSESDRLSELGIVQGDLDNLAKELEKYKAAVAAAKDTIKDRSKRRDELLRSSLQRKIDEALDESAKA